MVKDDVYNQVSEPVLPVGRKRTVSETSWKSVDSNPSAKFTRMDPVGVSEDGSSSDAARNSSSDEEEEPVDAEKSGIKLLSNGAVSTGDDEKLRTEKRKRRKARKKAKAGSAAAEAKEALLRKEMVRFFSFSDPESSMDHRCEGGRFLVSTSCVTNSNPYSLSSSETGC